MPKATEEHLMPCCNLLQRLNILYNDLADASQVDTVVSSCCAWLTVNLQSCRHKDLINSAKVLSHLSVKVLNAVSVCYLSVFLLLSIKTNALHSGWSTLFLQFLFINIV